METSFQVQKQGITNAADSEQQNDKPMDSTKLQVLSSSPFRLPNDWVVEEKPRRSDPSHVDRRHLAGETGDQVTAKQMISKDKNPLAEESGTAEIKVRGKRSSRKPANKYSSKAAAEEAAEEEEAAAEEEAEEEEAEEEAEEEEAEEEEAEEEEAEEEEAEEEEAEEEEAEEEEEEAAEEEEAEEEEEEAEEEEEEEMITPMSVKHSIPSASDEANKNNTEKNNRAPVHNLSLPPPAKVKWVLSGSEGMWTPFVDGSPVSEFEKLNWAEAFVLSLNDDELD